MPIAKSLTTFVWQGKNKVGATVIGEMNALNTTVVKIELKRQGIIAAKIKKKSTILFSLVKRDKIDASDIAIFTRQLATMLGAGLPIVQALNILEHGQTNQAFQHLINQMKIELESGTAFSNTLRKYPLYFNGLYCNLVAAGEQSGTLDTMLLRLATYREKTESIKNKVKKALFYPATVITIAMLISAGLLIFVVPQFQAIFSSFGAQLPALTLFVIYVSDFLQKFWWLILGILVFVVWGLIRLHRRSPPFAQKLDEVLLRLPILGSILHKSAIARFARTLSTTFAAGLPLIDALLAVASAAGSKVYTNAILQVREEVATGQTINLAMKNTHLFPSMVVQMIAVGEESGTLELMLTKIADYYEEQVDNAVSGLSSLLEPIIMVILGTIIGGLVLAMYIPIFRLGNVISGGLG